MDLILILSNVLFLSIIAAIFLMFISSWFNIWSTFMFQDVNKLKLFKQLTLLISIIAITYILGIITILVSTNMEYLLR